MADNGLPELAYGPSCTVCGSDMYYVECDQCGGDGFREVYEEDPLWYDEDDTETCEWCDGEGGAWFCLNERNHPVAEPPA